MSNQEKEKLLRQALSKKRVGHLNEDELSEIRDLVEDTHQMVEMLINNPDGAVGMNFFTRDYIVHPMQSQPKRLKALRLLSGFEIGEIAGYANITRQTYSKNEALGFENGLDKKILEILRQKSAEKLSEKGEDTKYANLWFYLIPEKKEEEKFSKEEYYKCYYEHIFLSSYAECPYCENIGLDSEGPYEKFDPKDEVKANLENIKDFQKKSISEKFNENKNRFLKEIDVRDIDPIYYINPVDDLSVLEKQLNTLDENIKNNNQNNIEYLSKFVFLNNHILRSALGRDLFMLVSKNEKEHKKTADALLKEKGYEKYDFYQERINLANKAIAEIMFIENPDWI